MLQAKRGMSGNVRMERFFQFFCVQNGISQVLNSLENFPRCRRFIIKNESVASLPKRTKGDTEDQCPIADSIAAVQTRKFSHSQLSQFNSPKKKP